MADTGMMLLCARICPDIVFRIEKASGKIIRRLLAIVVYDIFLSGLLYNTSRAALFLLTVDGEVVMDIKELKKLLAGLSIASLIAGAGLSLTGCATTG
jgi:radical SAM modification target selenobiotic family peptide